MRQFGRLYPMDIRDIFAANLRRIRHDKGYSQEALANEAEVNRSYVSRIERSGSYVSLKTIEKLAAILAVEPAEFLKMPLKRGRAAGKGKGR